MLTLVQDIVEERKKLFAEAGPEPDLLSGVTSVFGYWSGWGFPEKALWASGIFSPMSAYLNFILQDSI